MTYQHILNGRWPESAACSGFSTGYEGFSLYLRARGHLAVRSTTPQVCLAGASRIKSMRIISLTSPPILLTRHLFVQQFGCTPVFLPLFLGFHVPPPADRGTKTRLVIFGKPSNTSAPSDRHHISSSLRGRTAISPTELAASCKFNIAKRPVSVSSPCD